MLSNGVIFNLAPAKVCSPAIIEMYFSYDKDIWIAVIDYYVYFYLILLFLLVAILQFINFAVSSLIFSLILMLFSQLPFGPLHK